MKTTNVGVELLHASESCKGGKTFSHSNKKERKKVEKILKGKNSTNNKSKQEAAHDLGKQEAHGQVLEIVQNEQEDNLDIEENVSHANENVQNEEQVDEQDNAQIIGDKGKENLQNEEQVDEQDKAQINGDRGKENVQNGLLLLHRDAAKGEVGLDVWSEENHDNIVLNEHVVSEEAIVISIDERLKEKEALIVLLDKLVEDLEKNFDIQQKAVQENVKKLKSEITLLSVDIKIKQSEIESLKKELELMKAKQEMKFEFEDIKNNVAHFTGLPNKETFDLLLFMLTNKELKYYSDWTVRCLNMEQQLLMTLMKLRRNYSNIDLALRFGVSTATVTNVTLTFIEAMHHVLVETLMKEMPSRVKNRASMPKSFSQYSSSRVVLDCTEVFAANPKKMSMANAMYSNYKHRITLKGLVGIAPNGTVTFLSYLYPGSTSDKDIVKQSGVTNQLILGDFVMADKGFLIGELLPPGVSLNIPPFKTGPQMTPTQIYSTFSIAQARIHVERAIQRIKLFQILHFIPANYYPFASKIFRVCGALTNFMMPLISEVRDTML